VRRRLVLAIALVAVVSVALFALPLGVVLNRTYRDEELLRLQRDTVAAARQIDLSRGKDPIELPRSSDRLSVYDPAGRRLAGAGPAHADALVRAAVQTGKTKQAQRAGVLVTAVPLLAKERVSGAVRAERSAAAVMRHTHSAWLRLAGLAGVILLLALTAAVALGRRLAVPLERLAAAARRLGDGDFATRAPHAGVAELDAVGAALDTTARRLDDLVSREREFTADASHQLRTPLAALRIELEAMELRGDSSPELAAALQEVERLQTTIDTLLAIARDAPRDATPSTVLTTTVEELEQAWRERLARQARPLRIAMAATPAVARSSPTVVREILDVLLANACIHGAGAVTVAVRGSGAWIAVDVSDEGPGPTDPEEAFARRSGSGEGHGIGLALARSLAHAEGGRLALSTSGAHATFTLTLPRDVSADEARAPARSSSAG
jgi:signal transduction histidine kinase